MTAPAPSATGGEHNIDVLAAGGVLWRGEPDGVRVALVHRPRYDDWSLPKGKLDHGESMPAAAVREIAEETGFAVRLGRYVGQVRYEVTDGRKLVRYWSAQALRGELVANAETDELRWCTPREAAELLSYQRDVEVLHRFVEVGVPTALLLLVRHAKAGSRAQWEGTDGLRPLSGTGREQARQLARLLTLFGPDRIHSAPPERCRQTVEPLADALAGRLDPAADGSPIETEPLLGEEGYWDDPAAGLARVRALATRPGVTVVCSQGGVIPDVVSALVAGAERPTGVGPDDIRSRKASTWVLGMRDGGLVSADHYPRPSG